MKRSDYDFVMTAIPMECNSKIDEAARFLERMGHRFCIDFGLDNAIEIADWQYPEWDMDQGQSCPCGAD